MSSQIRVSDTFTLSGERINRLKQALRVAEHQVHVAQGGYGRHVEDALADIEEAITDHLARIENALDDDSAEAEEPSEAEHERHAYCSRYRAA
jgi:hypothetical protein